MISTIKPNVEEYKLQIEGDITRKERLLEGMKKHLKEVTELMEVKKQ